MTKKKFLLISCLILLCCLVSGYFVLSIPQYETDSYKLSMPLSFRISRSSDGPSICNNGENVGGIAHYDYAEVASYDELIALLQDGNQWASYSLEDNHSSDKLLSFVNNGNLYHHYIYRTEHAGFIDLWFCSDRIPEKSESKIVGHFEIKE